MTVASKVAVVTGGNRGIGLAIVRGLCKRFEGDVYLTARDKGKGEAAVAALNKEGLNPKVYPMDILNDKSIEEFSKFLSTNYGRLDVLVNNAGVAYPAGTSTPFAEQADVLVTTNYFATLNICKAMFPLLKPHARVVHVSSLLALYTLKKCSSQLQEKFKQCKTVDDVSQLMNDFIQSSKAGNYKQQGWPESAYNISKLGVSFIVPLQQRVFDEDKTRPDIVVNSADPGYVATDMTASKGHKTPDQGADTPLYAALLPRHVKDVRGSFLAERTVTDMWSVNTWVMVKGFTKSFLSKYF